MNFLIIDDHPITRIGLEHLIEDNFNAERLDHAKNGAQALKLLKENNFDIIILDIVLPDTDTHSLVHKIKRLKEDIKILMYSNYSDAIYAMPYIAMGASGFVRKTAPRKDLINAIKIVEMGQLYLPQKLIRENINPASGRFTAGSPFKKLSKRELEFFSHLITGKRMKDICEIMHIEQSTISTLNIRMKKKLGVKNMIELVRLAEAHNMF